MIDIHSHILPHVDDGARNLKDALNMARLAVKNGITHMFATPHNYYLPSRQESIDRTRRLQEELDKANIPLTVLPGHEFRLEDDALEDWDENVLGYSRYVLAEPLFHRYDENTEEMMLDLIEAGYIPIMAHPERIRPIQDDLSLLESFLERGGLTQVTSKSLTSNADRRAKRTAEDMLRQNMVHILASDTHNTGHRPPALAEARDIAAKFVGMAAAEAMVTTNPLAIINDEPIVVPSLA